MTIRYLRTVLYCLCLVLISTVYSDDVCDKQHIEQKLAALETKGAYKNCQLADMKKSYYDTARELMEILQILHTKSQQSLPTESDETPSDSEIESFGSAINAANTIIMQGEDVGLSADDSLAALRKWVTKVDAHSKDPMVKLDKVKARFTESSELFTVCQAEFHWKKAKKWRNRILSCVTKAETSSDHTAETVNPE